MPHGQPMMPSSPGSGTAESQVGPETPAAERRPPSAQYEGQTAASSTRDPRPRPLILQAVPALAIFLLAVWPRMVGLETFVTTDEIFWVGRSGNFARALASGRLASTFQTGHPGVTTMWAGLLGMGRERGQRLGGDRREVPRSPV